VSESPWGRYVLTRMQLTGTRWDVKTGEMPLVHLVCGGDKEAYWRLVQPQLRAVLWVSNAILGNSEDAAEVAQEAVLKGLRNIDGFRGETKFSTWLIQITVNHARDTLPRKQNCPSQSLDACETEDWYEYAPKPLTHWREIPLTALEHKEARNVFDELFWSLPQNHREVFAVRDIAQLSTRETAQVLGLNEDDVRVRLLRARLKLRDALASGVNGMWCHCKPESRRTQV
jgi:RNA polymerase sigma-70 factor (ECF subfamily)